MKNNTYVFILVKSDSSSFKVGLTGNLDETIDYYDEVFQYRKDRSFVFSGDYVQMKNLHNLFTSLIHNYKISSFLDEDFEDMFDIKGLPLLISFSEILGNYKIKTKKLSLRKTLEVCTPYRKVLSRKNKINLLFDFNSLRTEELENKYNINFEQLEKIYKDFLKGLYKDHKVEFKNYLKMDERMTLIKKFLLKKI